MELFNLDVGFSIEFLALVGIVILGSLVGAAIGFGQSTIFMALAVLLFPIKSMVPVVVPLNIVICLYLVLRYRDGINWRLLLTRIVPLTVLGMPVGIVIFNLVDTNQMKPFFGAFVVLLSIFEFWRNMSRASKSSRPPGLFASFIWLVSGGIAQGLWVTGGPMVAYWSSRAMANKHEFRSTLSLLWLILNLIILASHVSTGSITLASTSTSMALLPPLVAGTLVGEGVHNILPERTFKLLVNLLLLVSGLAILVNG